MNLLRVWGGGLYESDDLYDLCDEQGVLLWQDFLFACAAYAEEQPLSSEVVAEATEAVTRLAPHPSLVVWNGNNENLWGHEDWDWQAELGDLTWGRGYYLDVLPRLLARARPDPALLAGQPVVVRREPRTPTTPTTARMHVWDVWNRVDYTVYRDYRARFVGEFGYQGPPTWATLTRALHDDPLDPGRRPGMRAHQKAEDGDGKLSNGIAPHLPSRRPVADVEDWHWATQLQPGARRPAFGHRALPLVAPAAARARSCGSSTTAGRSPRGPPSTATGGASRSGTPCATPTPTGCSRSSRATAASPSSPATTRASRGAARSSVRRLRVDGAERAMTTVALDVPARGTTTVTLPRAVVGDVSPYDELLVATAGDVRTVHWFAEPKDLALTDGWADVVAEPTVGGWTVRVTASSVQRDVCLLVDKVDPDATVDDGMVTVLPGETHTFHVLGAVGADPADLTDPRVLRSANQLLRHRPGGPPTDPTTRPLTRTGASA